MGNGPLVAHKHAASFYFWIYLGELAVSIEKADYFVAIVSVNSDRKNHNKAKTQGDSGGIREQGSNGACGSRDEKRTPVRYADGYLIVYLDRQQEMQRRIGYTGMSGCFTSKIYNQKTDEPCAHHTRTNLLVLAIYTKNSLTFGYNYDNIDGVIKVLAFLGVLW